MTIGYPTDPSQALPATGATKLAIVRSLLAGQSLTVLDPKDQWRSFTGQVARPSLEPADRIPNGQQS